MGFLSKLVSLILPHLLEWIGSFVSRFFAKMKLSSRVKERKKLSAQVEEISQQIHLLEMQGKEIPKELKEKLIEISERLINLNRASDPE